MCDKFINLHVHTAFSLLDSTNTPEGVANKVKEMKQAGVAITEHGNTYSSVKMHKLCKDLGVKHIYACEFYIAPNRHLKDKSQRYYHMTILAKNEQGRININKLVSMSHEFFYHKPRIDFELLNQHKEGLIILSGCFVKDTKVMTERGLVNVQDIVAGDVVVSHTGKRRKVMYPTTNYHEGELCEIKTMGSSFNVTSTDNHEFLVIPNLSSQTISGQDIDESYFDELTTHDSYCDRGVKSRLKKSAIVLEPEWRQAKYLTSDDVLLTPIDEEIIEVDFLDLSKYKINSYKCKKLNKYTVKITDDFLELLGIYVAEGSVSTNNYSKITFSLDSRKQDLVDKVLTTMKNVFDVDATISHKDNGFGIELAFGGMELSKMFADWFGEGALAKKVPDFIKHLPYHKQMHFIKGAFLGDGSFREGNSRDIRYVSISKQLISDLAHILHRNLVNPCLSTIPEKTTKDKVHHQEAYVLAISGDLAVNIIDFVWKDKDLHMPMKNRRFKDIPFVWNGKKYMRQKITGINKMAYTGEVYCLNVDVDNSFVAEGVIAHNCMASELQQTLNGGKIGEKEVRITSDNYKKAKEIAMRYKQAFQDDYYLEIQSHFDPRQQKLNRAIVQIGKELNIKFVATSDSHFLNEEDLELHTVFMGIARQNQDVFEKESVYQDCQLQSEDEARERLRPSLSEEDVDLAISHTKEIFDKCNVKIPLSAPIIPHVKVPEGFKDENEYVKELCNKGWVRREINKKPKDVQKKYKERLLYEYNAVSKMGFSGYYLLVESYANEVQRRGVARGSGGGSLIAYLLNIVDIDPVEFELWFERFVDVGALDLLEQGLITREELKIPDVDLDFGVNEREKIVNKLTQDYGEEHVVSIGNFGYMKDKMVVKDVGRALGISPDITNAITKIIGEEVGDKAGEQLDNAMDGGKLKSYMQQEPKLFEYAKKLLGLPRSFGSHPCGKIICIEPSSYYTSTSIDKKTGQRVLQVDMKDSDLLGLVKVDILGLRTIDIIYDTLSMIGKDYEYINPAKQNWTDEKVLDTFRKGDTTGVFQFESDGMKQTLKKMVPTCLDDLAVANALFRPGSMKYIDNYINRKHGREKYSYLHDDLASILDKTFAIIVFQEQLISIGKMAGMRNPDEIRQATAKKKEALMKKVEPELRKGLYARGWTKEQVDTLWDDMLEFSKYSFNKAHSYAYAIIAYLCAKLKAYHPTEFMCALFNSYRDTKTKVNKYGKKESNMDKCHNESMRMKVPFAKFSFSNPSTYCTVVDGKINYGIALVKFCNVKIAEQLKELSKNKYKDFVDLLIDIRENTSLDTRQLKILMSLDFFHMYGGNKKLLDFFEVFEKRYKTSHVAKTKAVRIPELKQEWRKRKDEVLDYTEQVFKEKDLLGFGFHTIDCKKGVCLITNIDKKYTPKIQLYKLNTGEEITVKIKRKDFFNKHDDDVLRIGDVIQVKKVRFEDKTRKEGNKWVKTGDKEMYLEHCALIKRGVVPEIEKDETEEQES